MAEQTIGQELSVGQIISRTFRTYRRNFLGFFVIFAVVEVAVEGVGVLAGRVLAAPPITSAPTFQQVFASLAALYETLAVTVIASFVIGAMATGSAINMASDDIQTGRVELARAVRSAFSRLLALWGLSLVLAVFVGVGFLALFAPGVILGIMFSLAFPVLLLENAGIGKSLTRSRELVDHRWGKTFALFLVVGAIVLVPSLVLTLVPRFLGPVVGPIVVGVLYGFVEPIIPIAVVVFYYSNVARLAAPPIGPRPGTKFCPSCGTHTVSSALFCPKCGTRQPG